MKMKAYASELSAQFLLHFARAHALRIGTREKALTHALLIHGVLGHLRLQWE